MTTDDDGDGDDDGGGGDDDDGGDDGGGDDGGDDDDGDDDDNNDDRDDGCFVPRLEYFVITRVSSAMHPRVLLCPSKMSLRNDIGVSYSSRVNPFLSMSLSLSIYLSIPIPISLSIPLSPLSLFSTIIKHSLELNRFLASVRQWSGLFHRRASAREPSSHFDFLELVSGC